MPVRLTDFGRHVVAGLELSDADRLLAEQLERGARQRLVVRELRSGVEIVARGWVGVVHFETMIVSIHADRLGDAGDLVAFVAYAGGLDALTELDAIRTLAADGANLYDLIAHLFASSCADIVRRGLRADYLEREEELNVLRGRLLVAEQLQRAVGRVDRIWCRHDDHTQDIPDNRLLAAALDAAAPRVQHPGVRRQLWGLADDVLGVCEPDPGLADADLRYDRLNEHYRAAHHLACLLLSRSGPTDLYAGGATRSFAFLLDMPSLFEGFCERFVREALPTSCRVVAQPPNRLTVRRDDGSPYRSIRPDLLVLDEASDRLIAIDAKYKRYDDEDIAREDVYQLFLYAKASAPADRAATALILHPARTTSRSGLRLATTRGQHLANIDILGVDVGAALGRRGAEAARAQRERAAEHIARALGSPVRE